MIQLFRDSFDFGRLWLVVPALPLHHNAHPNCCQDVDPDDLGPYWYIKRDDAGFMDGDSSELPEDLRGDLCHAVRMEET